LHIGGDDRKEAGVTLKVHLQPRASRDSITGLFGDTLKVRVTSPPVGGKANKALKRLLAEKLGLAPSQIVIIGGQRSREKVLRINGITKVELERILGIGHPPL
jgi:uncharacterized protein (TIGR00251 family)